MTGMLDWTSLVTSTDADAAATYATTWVKTMVATILTLTSLFITFFFGNRIIGLLKSVLKG